MWRRRLLPRFVTGTVGVSAALGLLALAVDALALVLACAVLVAVGLLAWLMPGAWRGDD